MAGRIDFEERKEIKRELYQNRIDKANRNSITHYKRHDELMSVIPMGQPILIDHYSAKGHINHLKRSDSEIKKAINESDKAEYYNNKLDNLDNNKVVSSDDPKAIEKLMAKLQLLEEQKINIKARDHAWYELPYINADIKRVKDRIAEIKQLDELSIADINFNGGKLIINKEVNRVQFLFEAIPNEEVRTLLKSRGFKWSRYEQAWQRLLNINSIKVSQYIIKEIEVLL